MSPPALECRGLTVAYDRQPVLVGVDLTVAQGEVVALLGPSGSGKTTLLATVAGFVHPSAGEVALDGDLVAVAGRSVPPEARHVGVVFQHYALWPHLTALETVAYPLRRAGVKADEARRRARALLELVEVAELADRRPASLSGGQQQRVGLARALARDAPLQLFDEPTAHLDAALRASLQDELAARRAETGAAALYATHDAEEALGVADRVALLRAGRVVQVGPPSEVYERPADRWVALLTGAASVLTAAVEPCGDGTVAVTIGDVASRVPGGAAPGVPLPGRGVSVLLRPGWAHLGGDLPGVVRQVTYRGPHTDVRLDTPGGEVAARCPGPPQARPGDRVSWTVRRAWVVP